MKKYMQSSASNTTLWNVVLIGTLLSLVLFCVNSYWNAKSEIEMSVAPLLVLVLLTIGDKLLVYILLAPFRVKTFFKKNEQ